MAESLEQLRVRLRGALQTRLQRLEWAFERWARGDVDAQPETLSELHTLKGEARILGLTTLEGLAHALESRASAGHELADWPNSLSALRATLVAAGANTAEPVISADPDQSGLERTLRELSRHARAASERAGKWVRVESHAPAVALEEERLDALRAALLHLVENAVEHAFELPHERGAKPRTGRLCLRAELDGQTLRVVCEDDGRGIDLDALRAAAVERGWLSAEAAATCSAEPLYDLLFQSGFSTARQVSLLSGRGVGLDAVRRCVRELDAELDVESERGRGTRFVLRLPVG